MNTVTQSSPSTDSEPSTFIPITNQLHDIAASVRTKNELYRQCFRAIASHFDAPAAMVQLDDTSTSIEEHFGDDAGSRKPWHKVIEGFALNARYRNSACARLYESESGEHTFGVVATPLSEFGGPPVGSMAIVTRCPNQATLAARLNELEALCGIISAFTAPKPNQKATAKSNGASGLTRAGEFESFQQFAFAITNNLKGKLGCDQVCLGRVNGKRVKMVSLSGLDDVYPRSPGARLIEQAMEECLDAGVPICHQKEEQYSHQTATTGHRIHQTWSSSAGNAPVASLPLFVGEKCVAVLALRNPARTAFRPDQFEKITDLVKPLIPGLLLLERSERSLTQHTAMSFRETARRVTAPESRGRRVMGCIVALLLLWTVFGSQTYIVSVPCTVVPTEVRQVSAPFDGSVAGVYVESGQHVHKGQVLMQMDTTSLDIDQRQRAAEKRLAQIEMNQASEDKDHAAAARARARLKVADVQLEAINQQLEKAVIHAPVNGVVLTRDLGRRVGEVIPLGEPLIQISPQGAASVELQIPEHQAVHLTTGQAGQFTTNARPDEATDCIVDEIAPLSTAHEGSNVFVARCHITDGQPTWLRAGMNGVARVRTGNQPVWWIWLHRVVDSIRLLLWKI